MQDDRADAPLPDARKVELNSSTTTTTTTTTALDDVNNSALPAVKDQNQHAATEETVTDARQADGEVVGPVGREKGDPVTRSQGGGVGQAGAGGAMTASERVEEQSTLGRE